MTRGFDLSRYDDAGPDGSDAVADPWADFVILNIEDPRCVRKVERAVSIRKPWALYSWLYAGAGAASVHRLQAFVDLLVLSGLPVPPKGGFVDFEANGVSTGDAAAARSVVPTIATPCGFYTYLYLLNSLPGLADEWARWGGRWIAYYPWGDDRYPAGEIGSAQFMQSMLWQFTSSGGSRDRNVVVDEAAWAAWGTGTPVSQLVPMGDDDVTYLETRADGSRAYWKLGLGDYFEIPEAVALGEQLNGHGKPVPITTDQRVAIGLAAKGQADKYLAGKLGGGGATAPTHFSGTLDLRATA